jgi:DNA invertase Pin-like site-specific DNA recombinase
MGGGAGAVAEEGGSESPLDHGPFGAHASRRALGYASVVSASGQALAGSSLAAQEAAIQDACRRRGWTLLGVVRDGRGNGRSAERPGLAYALDRIAAGEASCLIVTELKRLGRSVFDFGLLLKWFTEAEATLVALDLDIDTSASDGRRVAQVLVSVTEWERARLATRTRRGLAAVRAEGRPISRPAVVDRPELKERIAAMRASGMTLQAIADALNAEEVPTLRGGAEWRPSSVQSTVGYKRRRARAKLPPARATPGSGSASLNGNGRVEGNGQTSGSERVGDAAD